MKLLVVEDENKTADYIRQGLVESGFVVDLARNGLDGHHRAMTEHYDLVVLDLMLPDIDGLKILQSLRSAGRRVPVLFLTARSSVDDRVRGLELGADDYLVKPFAFSELIARVRTRSSTLLLAVRNSTGTRLPADRRDCRIFNPSMSGSMRSSTTRS
jgi:two-component system, OmpR family, copper resistance phosphate regulon response regulator CusR